MKWGTFVSKHSTPRLAREASRVRRCAAAEPVLRCARTTGWRPASRVFPRCGSLHTGLSGLLPYTLGRSALNQMLRAFLVAPLGAVVVYGTLLLFDPPDGPRSVIALLPVLGALLMLCYLVEAIAAWPLLVFLRQRGLANPITAIAAGATLGLVLAGVFDLPNLNVARWHYYAVAALAGLLTAAIFAYTYFKRPNKPFAADGGR